MRFAITLCFFTVLLTACAGGAASSVNDVDSTPESVTPTPIPTTQPTPLPTGEGASQDGQTLVVWWPDTLSPGDRPQVNDLLNDQINGFVASSDENNVQIEFRIKRYGSEAGSIMPSLRATSGVAPGALPDLTLIRRSDLITAVDSGVIYPIENIVGASLIDELYPSSVRLGQVGGVLYGLPYMLDVQHMAYSPDALDEWDVQTAFDDMIGLEINWIFPARRSSGLNLTVYAQYLEASGLTLGADGALPLDTVALLSVLRFYENAIEAGRIDPSSLEYASVNDYAALITTGVEFGGALVSSNVYLSEVYGGRNLVASSIPTLSGDETGIVNGWMWVVTTSNVERQAAIARFLEWFMDTNRQAEFAAISHMIPSQPATLQRLNRSIVPVNTYDAILRGAIIPPPEPFNSVVARTIQTAFISVLSGEADAQSAVESVIDQLEND